MICIRLFWVEICWKCSGYPFSFKWSFFIFIILLLFTDIWLLHSHFQSIFIKCRNHLAGWSSGGSGFCFLQQGEQPLLLSFIASPVAERGLLLISGFEFQMKLLCGWIRIQMPMLIWAQMNAVASSLRVDRPLQTNIGRWLSRGGNLPGPGEGVG